MLRNHHVTNEQKLVSRTHFSECLHKEIPGPNRSQKRLSLITTKGDETEVAITGNVFEVLWHRSEERPTLCKLHKG